MRLFPKSKSKDSKKSSQKLKTQKTQENKNVFENIPIQDTSSIELNQLINPNSPRNRLSRINNINNLNTQFNNQASPKSEAMIY